jgi:hypothetical protein
MPAPRPAAANSSWISTLASWTCVDTSCEKSPARRSGPPLAARVSRNGPGIYDGDYQKAITLLEGKIRGAPARMIAANRGLPRSRAPSADERLTAGFGYKLGTYAASGGAPSRARRRGADGGARARAAGHSHMWDPQFDPLVARHRTLRRQLPGFGHSPLERARVSSASLGGPVAPEPAVTRCRRRGARCPQQLTAKHALSLPVEGLRVAPGHVSLPEISEMFGQSVHVTQLLR